MEKKESLSNRTRRIILLTVLSSFMVLPEAIGMTTVLVCTGLALIYYGQNRDLFKTNREIFAIAALVPLIYLISIAVSDDKELAFRFFIRSMLILAFPVFARALFSDLLRRQNFVYLLLVLLLSSSMKIILPLFSYFQSAEVYGFWDLREFIENETDIHGTYWAVFFGMIFIVALHELLFYAKHNWVYGIYALVSFGFLASINAKLPLLGAVMIAVIFLIRKWKLKGLLLSALAIGVIIYSIGLSSYASKRYFDEAGSAFTSENSYPEGIYTANHAGISSIGTRLAIYKCSWELAQHEPILGQGNGDVQKALNRCYNFTFNTNLFQVKSFNTHNQYMWILLSTGIVGLLIFVLFFEKAFSYTLRIKNSIGVAILGYIALCLLTENILDRHYGALIIPYFLAVFVLNPNLTK